MVDCSENVELNCIMPNKILLLFLMAVFRAPLLQASPPEDRSAVRKTYLLLLRPTVFPTVKSDYLTSNHLTSIINIYRSKACTSVLDLILEA